MTKEEYGAMQDRYLKILDAELERLNNKLEKRLEEEEKEDGEKTRD